MVPIIELGGAIPHRRVRGQAAWQVYIIAIIGNMIPGSPFIFFSLPRKVLEWGADGSSRQILHLLP